MERPARVLIVEDDAIIAMDIERCVLDCGYDVVGIASSGGDALKMANSGLPDVALMDFKLKGDLDGATVARELFDNEIKIVFLTAYLDQVVRETYNFASAFIAKPVTRKEIRFELDRALKMAGN